MTSAQLGLARSMWTVFEPVHAVVYFAAHARRAFEEAGVRGFWRAYFAGRAAPLGRVGPHAIHAAFQSFTFEMVARALPGVWDLIEPDEAWRVRCEAAAAAVAACTEGLADDALTHVDGTLRNAVAELDSIGRPFFAAHLDLAWPDDVYASIWQACTLLREHRGDGYVHACLDEDVTGLEMMVLADRLETVPPDHALSNRGWTSDDLSRCVETMTDGGLLDPNGTPTDAGLALRDRVEAQTDALAAAPWVQLDTGDVWELFAALEATSRAIADRGWLSYPNAIGVTPPDSVAGSR